MKVVPGFYVNQCLGPILAEVTALVKEGVHLETLDKAMKKFGMHWTQSEIAWETFDKIAS